MVRNTVLSAIVLSILLLFGCASKLDSNGSKPVHHTEDGFRNLYVKDNEKGLGSFLRMRWLGDDDWADYEALAYTVKTQLVNIDQLDMPAQRQITWLGHSTFLLQIDGKTILTDPIFSNRASPVSFAGPERYIPHLVNYNELPTIDHVIISHNHYDHLDEKTISFLARQAKFHVPLGLKQDVVSMGVAKQQVFEYDWWQSLHFGQLKIEALPSQHWSARGLFDRFDTLWASWSISLNGYQVWFAGDTGYNDVQFKEIGEHLGNVDLALIPIGAYKPRWFMKTYHLNPLEAIKVHNDINSKLSIGMHWGAFPLSAEAPMDPVVDLEVNKEKNRVLLGDFIVLEPGETNILLD